jgi:hypothetical protein
MNHQAPSSRSEIESAAVLEGEAEEAISLCGGDVRAALRATLLANAFLEAEIERLSQSVSAGVARGKIRQAKLEKKAG